LEFFMRLHATILIAATFFLAGCGGTVEEPAEPVQPPEPEKLDVYTVNYPLAYFAERVGGDGVTVNFPAPADEDPAFWSPDAETIAAYQQADLILINGAGYAKWVERATLPSSKIIDTTAGAADRLVALEGTVTHSHGPEGEHEHVGWAFTTWLDPTLAIEQARAVADALVARRPDQKMDFRNRFSVLEAQILDLDRRLEIASQAIGDAPLVFSHPVYQYLIARYGLNGEEAHWEPNAAPSGHDWEHLSSSLANHGARWMVWEAEPLPSTVQALVERGISSVIYDPCGNRPNDGDFMTVMDANAEALERIAE
jgi:zinc transport system substrate-binding protein